MAGGRAVNVLRAEAPGLRLAMMACAATSLAALVAHVAGVLPMRFFLTFFGAPSVFLLFVLAAYARWIDARALVRCLSLGLAGGIAGTLAYDGVRLALQATHLFRYDAFLAIYIFGTWISGRPVGTPEAAVWGWIYHYWNGLSFGILFLLTFGGRSWLYGVAYGLVMEACMLGLFPIFLRVSNKVDFITVSLIGHAVYGAVLGQLSERYARSWRDQFRPRPRRLAGALP